MASCCRVFGWSLPLGRSLAEPRRSLGGLRSSPADMSGSATGSSCALVPGRLPLARRTLMHGSRGFGSLRLAAKLGPLSLRPAFLKLDCLHDFAAGLDRGFEALDHVRPGDGFALLSGVGQPALGFLA
jgi:hypothetical protein